MLSGALPIERFKTEIDRALKDKSPGSLPSMDPWRPTVLRSERLQHRAAQRHLRRGEFLLALKILRNVWRGSMLTASALQEWSSHAAGAAMPGQLACRQALSDGPAARPRFSACRRCHIYLARC